MARTKVDDLLIAALGDRRAVLAARIESYDPDRLSKYQAELVEIEQTLKEIDPAIPSLDEEAAAVALAVAEEPAKK